MRPPSHTALDFGGSVTKVCLCNHFSLNKGAWIRAEMIRSGVRTFGLTLSVPDSEKLCHTDMAGSRTTGPAVREAT